MADVAAIFAFVECSSCAVDNVIIFELVQVKCMTVDGFCECIVLDVMFLEFVENMFFSINAIFQINHIDRDHIVGFCPILVTKYMSVHSDSVAKLNPEKFPSSFSFILVM